MTRRQRVLTALARREPDRVPYMEFSVDRALAQRLLGWGAPVSQRADLEANPYSPDEMLQLAELLELDNLSYVLRAPVYAEKVAGKDGRLFYGEGLVRSESDLGMIRLPDPRDEALYAGARELVARKGDRALCFVTRAGVFPALLSMGLHTFSLALFDAPGLLAAVLDRYFEWSWAVAERACAMGFDIYVTTDDMAFKTAPYFSPDVFREWMLPLYRALAQRVTLPWVVHSDGNILPFLDDLIDVGVAGIHPVEKGAMDIRALKRTHGRRVCLLGNVDLNILTVGTPAETDEEVRGLIRDVAPDGGYIVTSGNSLAGYCLPENVRALASAVKKYGRYPIAVD